MLLVFHVVAALGGILASTFAAISPSKNKIYLSSGLIATTVASGFILVWQTRTHILQTCISGLAYIAFTSAILIFANHRLVSQKESNR